MAKRLPALIAIATALRVAAAVPSGPLATPPVPRRGRFGIAGARPWAFAALSPRAPRATSPSQRIAAFGPDGSVADLQDSSRRDDDVRRDAPPSSPWGAADAWGAPRPFVASRGASDATTADEAARLLEERRRMLLLGGWDVAGAAEDEKADDGVGSPAVNDGTYVRASGDDFVENAIEAISGGCDYDDPGDLEISASSLEENAEEEELLFLIRCNQSPRKFVASHGRAPPEPTDEAQYSPGSQLMMDECELF